MDVTELRPGFGSWMPGVVTDGHGRVWGLWHPGGCWSSGDGGETWTAHPLAGSSTGTGSRVRFTALAAGPDGGIYVGTARGEVHESHDGGITWACHTLTGIASVRGIVATAQGVVAIGARMYRRPANDLAWLTGPPRGPVVTAFTASEKGTVYAGFRAGRRAWLSRSDDAGARWTELSSLPRSRRVFHALAATGDTLYAAVADVTSWGAAECEGRRSADRGTTWSGFVFPSDPRQWIAALWAAGPVVYAFATGFNLDDGGTARDAMLMRSADGCHGWDAELYDGEKTYAVAGGPTGEVWFARDGGGLLRVRDPAVIPHVAARYTPHAPYARR